MAPPSKEKLKWLIVEDGLKDLHGHFLDFVTTFVRELTRFGDEVVVFGAQGLNSIVASQTHALPVMPGAEWWQGSLKSATKLLQNGVWLFGSLFALLKHRRTVDHSNVVFVPTARVQHLILWRLYLACRRRRFKGTLLLFFMTTPVSKKCTGSGYELRGIMGKIFARLISSLASGEHGRQIRLATETRELSGTLAQLCAANFEVLPQPVEQPHTVVDHARRSGDIVSIGSFGPPRDEKGSHMLVEAISGVVASGRLPQARFVLQWTSDFLLPDGKKATIPPALRSSPNVTLIGHYFRPGEYEAVLLDTDAVVLPYSGEYELRGSRVLIDALVRGLPVAVTKGTSLETLAREHGRVVFIENLDPASIEEALHKLVQIAQIEDGGQIPSSKAACEYFSVRNFRDILVRNSPSL